MDKKASLKSGADIWRRSRFHLSKLANFYGYVPAGFEWKDSEVAKYDLSAEVYDNARTVATDTDGKTVNQQRHHLTQTELIDMLQYGMILDAKSASLMLAFCSIAFQTLARSRQFCKLRKVHVSLYLENYELPVNPMFGPVQMLQLGDRGNHKVDKLSDMSHWVMRTFKPSLKCPWFGMASMTALDARERQGSQYDELYDISTGKLLHFALVICTLFLICYLPCCAMLTFCVDLQCPLRSWSAKMKLNHAQGEMEDGASFVRPATVVTSFGRTTRTGAWLFGKPRLSSS